MKLSLASALRVLSVDEQATIVSTFENSKEYKRLQDHKRNLQTKIEVMNVGSYSDMDRRRTYSSAATEKAGG